MSTSSQTYHASKTRTNRPGWSVIFSHPRRTDSRGRYGLKIRKGLNTTDDAEADRLVGQLNELLSDQRWWSIDRRKEALLKFDELIVKIFFTGMESGKVTSAELREARIPFPKPKNGYAKVLFAGTTGAGKTTLLRHFIGSDHTHDRFPSTSTSRTTTAETEIITASGPYSGVVTFMPEHEVRAHIDECLEEACLCTIQQQTDAKIMAALLTHREQRFRISYVIGAWDEGQSTESDDFSFDDETVATDNDPSEQESVTSEQRSQNQKRLDEFLARIKAVTELAGARTASDFGELADQENPENRATWLELFGEAIYEQDEFARLALDVLEDIEDRFNGISSGTFENSPTGWPVVWTFTSADRDEFLRQLRWFSSNHHKQFGRLLTPLVDGVRAKGPLHPDFAEFPDAPKLVLLDGEGIGHTAKSASSISTRITRRFSEADLILLVDNAEQPMQSAPLEFLRVVGNSGNGEKLAVAFTHFDQVKGTNFGSFDQKKSHVLSSVRDTIGTLRQSIGAPVAMSIEKRMDTHAFFLGGMDREIGDIPKGFRNQLSKLLSAMQDAAQVPEPVEATPIYSIEGLEISLRDAVEGFQAPWKARLGLQYRDGIEKEHWTRLKALARRLANAWEVEYDGLRPVADLVLLLQENISRWLDAPADWTAAPKTDEERTAALSRIRTAVFDALILLVEIRMAENHRPDWTKAFDHKGPRSSYRRAEEIDRIYEEAAPLMNAAMTTSAREFLHSLYRLVGDAVEKAGGKFQTTAIARSR